jgi:hypothetical protein
MALFYIDFNRLQVYEAGALLLAYLAYPGEDGHDDQRRGQVHASLCACMLRARYEVAPDWGSLPLLIKPVYALQTERDRNQGLRQFKRRLRDRMIAARMASPFLEEAATGEAPELPPSLKRLSINAMSELVLEDAGYNEPENVEARIWRPSRPVIHLASAVHGYLHLGTEIEAHFLRLLLDCREVIEQVVRKAEYYESLVASSRELHVDAEKLIKFRLA